MHRVIPSARGVHRISQCTPMRALWWFRHTLTLSYAVCRLRASLWRGPSQFISIYMMYINISLTTHNTHTTHTQSICVWYRRKKAPPNFRWCFYFCGWHWNYQCHPFCVICIVVAHDQRSHRRFHKEWWRRGLRFQGQRCFHDLENPIVQPCRLV